MIGAVTFAAGSVIVAATLCPELGIRLTSDAGRASWDQAVQIFQFYRHYVPTADKALEALELFRRCVMKRAEAVRGEISQKNAALHSSTWILTRNLVPGGDWSIISDGTLADNNPPFDSRMAEPLSVDWNQLLDSTSLDMAWLTSQDVVFEDWLLPAAVS